MEVAGRRRRAESPAPGNPGRANNMTTGIDLRALLAEIGPRFAERAAAHDDSDSFVADNYEVLRERKLFSALVPQELGGAGARHSEMCGFLRGLAHHCASTDRKSTRLNSSH